MKKNTLFIAAAFLLNACDVANKAGEITDKNTVVVNLDTIVANGNDDKINKYRASETRLNDIIHTKLEVSFDWEKQYLLGQATIDVKPYFYPTTTLLLDARGMEIKEVALMQQDTSTAPKTDSSAIFIPSKKALKYTYEEDVITIQLDKEYLNAEQYSIFIDYVAKPNELKAGGSDAITSDKGLYFINPDGSDKDKPQQIWTQGETQSSSVWFPTIDRPNERMTQEIYMTVQKRFLTLSNGELVFSMENENDTRTDYWKMDLPHAPYLAMMMVGEFAMVKDEWREKKVNYYVEKDYKQYAKSIFGHTPEMMEFYSNKLGVAFPWNKYSQITARDYVSGAMENTTAALFGDFMHRTDREMLDKDYEYIVAHELFHEWFGDLVTCESWSNLPLNESFATYGEYLWEEYKYGKDAAEYHSAKSRRGYLNESKSKQENLIRFYYDEREDMFDAHSYNKGGQILHMLRMYVGDDAFYAGLKLYLETNKYASVEIHNLRLAFEKVTGEDLNWFFNQWFLSSGHPVLEITQHYDEATKKVIVQIQQTQNFEITPIFKIPMAIDIYVNGSKERQDIVVTKAKQSFAFAVASKPDLVNVDADKMLLCAKNEKKMAEEWAFQYRNAPLYLDRLEALQGLAIDAEDSIATTVILSALQDKFWNIRTNVIGALADIAEGHEDEIKEALTKLVETDKKSKVRVAAIKYLSENFEGDTLLYVYNKALKDSSYNVIGAAILAMTAVNEVEGLELASRYDNSKYTGILSALAELYSKYGNEKDDVFYVQAESRFTRYTKITFVRHYVTFLKKVDNDETTQSGAALLGVILKKPDANKWVKRYAKKGVNDLAAIYGEEISAYEKQLKNLKPSKKNAEEIEGLEKNIASAKAKHKKVMDNLDGEE